MPAPMPYPPPPAPPSEYVDIVGIYSCGLSYVSVILPAASQLKTLIASIPANAQLVDENEGAPRCMDAGSSAVSIALRGKDVPVYKNVDCHTLTVQTGYSEQLYTIMMGFVNLAQ